MRILHALHGFPPEFFGGSELYVLALAQNQVEGGHKVEIVAGTNADGPAGRATTEYKGLPVHRMTRTGLFHERWDHGDSPAETTLYRELLEEFQPDLVHVHHWMRLSRDLVRLAHALKIPTVLTLHDLFVTCPRIFRVREGESFCERPLSAESCLDCVPTESWMGSALTAMRIEWFAQAFREEIAAASALVVPSLAHAEFLSGHLEQEVGDFEVLPHGSILSWKSREKSAVWDGETPLRIAHWGHLQELKGVHILAEALSSLEDKSRVQLVLWGKADDPDFGAALDARLFGIEVERREVFTRDDLATLDAHIAVFPTLAHESHSFVLDEAFALGLPVLASARGALPERIAKGGRVFAPGDADALAALLQEFIDSPPLWEQLGQDLPRPVSMGKHWEALEKVYVKAASQKCEPVAGQALARARRYEELVQILEARCRKIEGLREKAMTEGSHLEKSLEDFEGSLAGYRRQIQDKDRDLDAHRERIQEIERDLRAHKDRIQEVQSDLAAHQVRLQEVQADLAAHRTRVQELQQDLECHRTELSRARSDFEVTEGHLIAERKQHEALVAEHGRLEETLARESQAHKQTLVRLTEVQAYADRLSQDLQASVQEVEGFRIRVDALEQREARLLEEKQRLEGVVEELTVYSTRLRRENRLALPLVLPARLLLAIKDRFLGASGRNSDKSSDQSSDK